MLYNNGYVVKGKYKHELYSQEWPGYLGIGSYTSWPLQYLDGFDDINEEIEELYISSSKGYFLDAKYKSFPRTLCFVQDEAFIKKYINICEKQQIRTITFRLESEIEAEVRTTMFPVVETLGWDCIAQSYYSYLDELFDLDVESKLVSKLNKNGLFDCIEDVKQFVAMREAAILNGVNLEDAFEPIPGKLSIVKV